MAIQRYDPEKAHWKVVAEHQNNTTLASLLNLVVADDDTAVAKRLKRLEMVELDACGRWAEPRGVLPGRWLLVPLHIQDELPWGCLGIRRIDNRDSWQSLGS